ncbi:MAG: hypothetical protein VKJ85_06535 [Prochlorothrix sp.]|nr:hypothetical protein [Prochlorothrix sp.]
MTNTLKRQGSPRQDLPRPDLPKRSDAVVIELAHGVVARTSVAPMNHSALRSGFAGQPANPRWNASKVVAWKTGRQWRSALARGEMIVRPSDSMLVPVVNQPVKAHWQVGPFCFLRDAFSRRHKSATPTS